MSTIHYPPEAIQTKLPLAILHQTEKERKTFEKRLISAGSQIGFGYPAETMNNY
jgi:hypothetical protein